MRVTECQDCGRRIFCIFRCVAAATPACSLRSTQATTQPVPETAPARRLRSVRDWQHPQSPCRSGCAFSPPHYAPGVRRNFQVPNPRPHSFSSSASAYIHPSWDAGPCSHNLHLQIGHSEPCYFDVPGDAPSTLTEFAGVVQDSRGLRRLGGSGCDHRLRQTQTQRREEGRGQRVPRQRTRLAQAVTGGHSA
jgi:hypothetical protein